MKPKTIRLPDQLEARAKKYLRRRKDWPKYRMSDLIRVALEKHLSEVEAVEASR